MESRIGFQPVDFDDKLEASILLGSSSFFVGPSLAGRSVVGRSGAFCFAPEEPALLARGGSPESDRLKLARPGGAVVTKRNDLTN